MSDTTPNPDPRIIPLKLPPSPDLDPAGDIFPAPSAADTTGTDSDADRTPEFPLDALPSPLREQVEHAAKSTYTPLSLCAANGIAAASASIGAGLKIQSGMDRLTSANLYILAIAQSGTGKGLAFRAMMRPYLDENLARIERRKTEDLPKLLAAVACAEADIEKAKKLRRKAATQEERDQAKTDLETATASLERARQELDSDPSLNIGQSTAEAIGVALANSPGQAGAILSAEARDIVDNLLGRYSKSGKGSDEPIFLQAYSGDPTTIRRVSRPPIVLHRPVLTIFLSVQPDIWNRVSADERMIESGFLPRCLAFDPRARPCRSSSHVIPSEASAAWAGTLGQLLAFRDNPDPDRVVHPCPEARAHLDALENEAADKREEGAQWYDVAGFAARLHENAWRLALVFHAIEHEADAPDKPLSLATAQAAERTARWFFSMTLALLRPARQSRQAKRIDQLEAIIRTRGADHRSMTVRDLTNRHGFNASELTSLAREFPERLRIRIKPQGPQGGRPSHLVELPPFPSSGITH